MMTSLLVGKQDKQLYHPTRDRTTNLDMNTDRCIDNRQADTLKFYFVLMQAVSSTHDNLYQSFDHPGPGPILTSQIDPQYQ